MNGDQRDLVIVMAGDNSLHEKIAEDREYDLWIVYYGGSDDVAARYEASCDRLWRLKGLKIELIRSLLLEHLHFGQAFDFAGRYRYVFLPDDDIDFPGGTGDVHDLFEHAARLQADSFQPAISNDNVSFGETRQIPGAFCHRVSWVENMMPAYTGELFVHAFLAGVHALDFLRSGWGLESVAMKLGEARLGRGLRTFVIDVTPVVHTRPVGRNSVVHEVGWDERLLLPQVDTNPCRTLGVYTRPEDVTDDLRPLPRSKTAIALSMQKVRHMRKLWKNLIE